MLNLLKKTVQYSHTYSWGLQNIVNALCFVVARPRYKHSPSDPALTDLNLWGVPMTFDRGFSPELNVYRLEVSER